MSLVRPAGRTLRQPAVMKTLSHVSQAPTPLGPESFVDEISRRHSHQARSAISARGVVAYGERRSFLRVIEDIAQAADLPFRRSIVADGPRWTRRDIVVVEADVARSLLRSAPVATRPEMCVVVGVPGGADPWSVARCMPENWGIPEVVMFPQGRLWLADRLTVSGRERDTWPKIAVMGSCGGIGATSLVLWTALRMKDDGQAPVVIDAVPGSVALDACMSADLVGGARWLDIEALPTLPDGARLLSSLPAPHGIPVITNGTGDEPGRATDATRRRDAIVALSGQGPVIVDVGADFEPSEEAGDFASPADYSCLVLVVPFTVRGLANAQSIYRRWQGTVPVLVVGTGLRWCDVSDREAAEIVGTDSLTAVIPHLRAAPEAYEAGRIMELAYRKPLRRPLAELVDGIGHLAEERISREPAVSSTETSRPGRRITFGGDRHGVSTEGS